mgnify:CR=1 FL=1
MRALSSAYLMKLGWWMVNAPNRLWARVFSFKYYGGRELLYPQTSTLAERASNGWRGILDQLYFVRETVGMAMGDNCATRFYSTLGWIISRPHICNAICAPNQIGKACAWLLEWPRGMEVGWVCIISPSPNVGANCFDWAHGGRSGR